MKIMTHSPITCSKILDAPARLDKYLLAQFPDKSRNVLQQLIAGGNVIINDTVVTKNNYVVRSQDKVVVTFSIPPSTLEPIQTDFDVIDMHEDFIVINKPAGLLVHQASHHTNEPTLVNGLLYRFKDLVAYDQLRPGIVHRIDRNTSGLLLVARRTAAHALLADMFKNRHIQKTYLAIVQGHPQKEGSIDSPIGRNFDQPNKMSIMGIAHRQALTHYKVVQYLDGAALLEVRIVTGRTHQIRVHMASIGHPLIGDHVYGSPSSLIGRHALHAWKMSFTYNNDFFSYKCPLPSDLENLLSLLIK